MMSKKLQHKPRGLADHEEKLWAEVRKTTKRLEGVTPRAMAYDDFFSALEPLPRPLQTTKTSAPKALAQKAKPSQEKPKADTANLAALWDARPAPMRSLYSATKDRRKNPLDPIEPRLRRRIIGGREDIDAKIDLHGLTQADAHPVLHAFIHRSFSRGFRTVLVITGKGRSAGSEGVLRRMVPLWLNQPELKLMISAWDESSQNHGGQGALYVRLRRQ